jgi:hypothetical protein
MNDVATAGIIVAVIVLMIWRIASSVRELRGDRDQRVAALALVVVACAVVPTCLLVERVTGKSPLSSEPTFAIRRGAGVVALLVWLAFIVWRTSRTHAEERSVFIRERDAFAEGKSCIACGSPLNLERLHHPVRQGDSETSDHWLNVCSCGELTLFEPGGNGRRVEDRSKRSRRHTRSEQL